MLFCKLSSVIFKKRAGQTIIPSKKNHFIIKQKVQLKTYIIINVKKALGCVFFLSHLCS